VFAQRRDATHARRYSREVVRRNECRDRATRSFDGRPPVTRRELGMRRDVRHVVHSRRGYPGALESRFDVGARAFTKYSLDEWFQFFPVRQS
jgi:hypothetical protein